ncbi:Uncharacterized protein APZ42_026643 [Daphnia magna]|uniref:DUF4806 domain-containing protein n=1 Tax=Daphnia magna TaxID=35525 RepID=A0A164S1F5_9CRUS|nr:Uncharacterized protein APZ42_026643 [Daphnia magna]
MKTRGQREKKIKKFNLPGESTTEVESEEELRSQSTREAGVRGKSSKKRSPKKHNIVKPTSTLPKPPAGLRVSKGKTLKEEQYPSQKGRVVLAQNHHKEGWDSVQFKEVCKEKGSNAQQLDPVNASNIHLSTSEEGSLCNVDLTIQPTTQPKGSICRLDTVVADDSYGTQHFVTDSNTGTSSSAEYSSYPTPTPSPSPDLCQSGNSGAVQQIYRHPSVKTNLPVMPDIEDSLVGVPEKNSRGASVNEYFISALAKINDKLNVIEKSIKPVSDDEAAEIQEDIDSLPLTSLEQLHSFEKVLTTDKNIFKKLVSRIRLLGRDRRVNNGSGKTGISSCTITKAVEDGIRLNKRFVEMEHESFIRETKLHLRKAKSRFFSAEINAQPI